MTSDPQLILRKHYEQLSIGWLQFLDQPARGPAISFRKGIPPPRPNPIRPVDAIFLGQQKSRICPTSCTSLVKVPVAPWRMRPGVVGAKWGLWELRNLADFYRGKKGPPVVVSVLKGMTYVPITKGFIIHWSLLTNQDLIYIMWCIFFLWFWFNSYILFCFDLYWGMTVLHGIFHWKLPSKTFRT